MGTVELHKRRQVVEAEDEALAAVRALLAASDTRNVRSIASAADAAYLAVGRLAALARAASQT